jgi:hypothetical protein
MVPPAINQTSKYVLQRKSKATLFDERHNRQQQGNGNKRQCDVCHESTSFNNVMNYEKG